MTTIRGQEMAIKWLSQSWGRGKWLTNNNNNNPRGQKVAVKELIKDSSAATQNFLGEAKVMT